MKQKTLLFVLMLFAGYAFAQTPAQNQPAPAAPPTPTTEKPLAEVLNWMVADWQGEGVMAGNQEFLGTLKATKELDDQAILLFRESMNKEGGVSGGKKEIMIIGFEGATKKVLLTVNSSNNTLLIYSGEMKNNEVVFSLVIPTPQAGFTHRRIFKLLPDNTLYFAIESGTPEKQVGKTVEINFKKKA